MKHLRNFLFGFVLAIAGAASAASLGYFGTSGGIVPGPQDPSQLYYYLNSLVAALNANFQFNSGELAFNQTNSFSANSAVATSLTSLGPTGSHTTVQEWLIVVDPSGNVRYIPCF